MLQMVTGAILAVLAAWVLLRCALPLFRPRREAEVWANVELPGRKSLPLRYRECVLGRSAKADIRVEDPTVGRNHAVLERSEAGEWRIYDMGSRSGTWVNGQKVTDSAPVRGGDTLRLGEAKLRFRLLTETRRRALRGKAAGAHPARPLFTLALVTAFQGVLLLQQLTAAAPGHRLPIALAFGALMALEWAVLPLLLRQGIAESEPVLLCLLLTTVGFSVAASSTPEGMGKQCLLFALGLGAFFLLGQLLSDLDRARTLRWAMAFGALGFLALNLLLSERIWGAKNWLSIAGQSLQPSEFVKIAYIYAGSATLDRLYRKRYLILFMAFSAAIVAALAIMGDFGTALVFFLCFLVIFFLRSGSLLTVALAVLAGTGAAGVVLAVKPYVARRFLTWGHAWETPLNEGFQQVRAMSAAAAGGLFGRGAGSGWLRDVVAADTDLVFALVCEELGVLTAVCCVLAVVLLAVYAVRRAGTYRSSFTLIAACAAVTVYLVQTGLNVFGSLDLLPFTGVTFPFVSRGGSSLVSCWGLLAYVAAGGERESAPAPAAKKPAAAAKKPKATSPAAKPARTAPPAKTKATKTTKPASAPKTSSAKASAPARSAKKTPGKAAAAKAKTGKGAGT